jgi:hypothetical protein
MPGIRLHWRADPRPQSGGRRSGLLVARWMASPVELGRAFLLFLPVRRQAVSTRPGELSGQVGIWRRTSELAVRLCEGSDRVLERVHRSLGRPVRLLRDECLTILSVQINVSMRSEEGSSGLALADLASAGIGSTIPSTPSPPRRVRERGSFGIYTASASPMTQARRRVSSCRASLGPSRIGRRRPAEFEAGADQRILAHGRRA